MEPVTKKRGRKPIGARAMTAAERQMLHRAGVKAKREAERNKNRRAAAQARVLKERTRTEAVRKAQDDFTAGRLKAHEFHLAIAQLQGSTVERMRRLLHSALARGLTIRQLRAVICSNSVADLPEAIEKAAENLAFFELD